MQQSSPFAGKFLDSVDLGAVDWLTTISPAVALGPGTVTGAVEVPRSDAEKILRSVVRRVADLPRNSSPEVVWTLGQHELLVHTDQIRLALFSGVAVITNTFSCEQVDGRVTVPVPLGLGTRKVPAGLIMTSFTDLDGPSVITKVWTDAITAFAWECLMELCRTIAAEVGDDSRGRALIPGAVTAAPGLLIIEPLARHTGSKVG